MNLKYLGDYRWVFENGSEDRMSSYLIFRTLSEAEQALEIYNSTFLGGIGGKLIGADQFVEEIARKELEFMDKARKS